MLRMVARDRPIAVTTPASEPEMRVMSAASIATSVPVPMASPTSAAASAGASLMPSPTMPTRAAFGLQPADLVGLVLGQHLGQHPAHARPGAAMAAAVRGVVAGEHDDVDAEAVQGGDRGGGVVLDGVGDGEHPGGPAVDGGQDRGLALSADSCGGDRLAAPAVSMPASASSRAVPTRTACPSTVACTPLPVTESNPVAAGSARPRSRAPATIAAPRGCSLSASAAATSVSSVVLVRGRRRRAMSVSAGLPAVMVPVLSSTIGVQLVRGLQRLGGADQDAGLGALAGADHDRQRGGQAERARAGDDQHRDRGDQREREAPAAGPAMNQTAKVTIAMAMTAGTKYPETASASRWIGALEAWACCTRRMIWASMVSAPTLSARTRSDPVLLMVAPIDGVARRAW